VNVLSQVGPCPGSIFVSTGAVMGIFARAELAPLM
jgi:hypothetical protein